jgi:hypothetical protein
MQGVGFKDVAEQAAVLPCKVSDGLESKTLIQSPSDKAESSAQCKPVGIRKTRFLRSHLVFYSRTSHKCTLRLYWRWPW